MGRKKVASNRSRTVREINDSDYDDVPVLRNKHRQDRIRKTPAATNAAEARFKKVEVEARTENQQVFMDLLQNKTITFGVGCAGTGKSFLAVHAAVMALVSGQVDSIVITRTMTTVGKAIGHLPGTEQEKLMPYVAPMVEYLSEFLGREEVNKLIKANIIRVIPLALLRGYTFRNAFIILDEAQNTTPNELKTILTRIGDGSRMAVLGDLEQCDIEKHGFVNGLEDFVDKMSRHRKKNPDVDVDIDGVEFDLEDIQRSKIVRDVLEIYDM